MVNHALNRDLIEVFINFIIYGIHSLIRTSFQESKAETWQ